MHISLYSLILCFTDIRISFDFYGGLKFTVFDSFKLKLITNLANLICITVTEKSILCNLR